MRNVTVSHYMTRGTHAIGRGEPMAAAHGLMNDLRVRHLAVVDERGELVGIVSQRDLHFLETLKDVDPRQVTVEEAMTQPVYTVPARATLRRVAGEMAERKLGSAIIVDERGGIEGIFTTTDALRALAELLSEEG